MKTKELPYDESNPEDIERYAKKLIGRTFYDILEDSFTGTNLDLKAKYYDNPRGKGTLGNLLEEHYFFYLPNSESEPDFAEAGTELKATPFEVVKGNEYRAGERLVICMIPNREPITSNFYESHLLKKMKVILLVEYRRDRTQPRTSYQIEHVQLFSILSEECAGDLEIIMDDYEKITSKIIAGKAHELSEGDTRYLGACTKGQNSKSMLQPQYYNPKVKAKRRAFSLKQSYMTYVLNHYILQNRKTYDPVFTTEDLSHVDFDKEIINRINEYVGLSENELYEKLEIQSSCKQKNNVAVCRMLGVKSNNVEEFVKADIKIKTIRVQKNGKPKESMSFPKMKIKDFVKEEFEDSKVYQYFAETRFLFVVFRENDNGTFILSGAKFWNMPIIELETTGYKEWRMYQDCFINGVKFELKKQKNGIVVKNNLPKKRDTKIFHLRPHASKASYYIKDLNYISGRACDRDELPNGDMMTIQCFWLNDDYIKNIIRDI